MYFEENKAEKNKNYIREKLFTNNEEKEKENENNKNFTFNLEYQKIINTSDGQSKITSKLKKLINFVRERYYYRDIKGNRIIPKGILLPTPFQKLQKINEEIKNYYEAKINRKNSPLIVKNYRNKNIYLETNYNDFNNLSNTNRRKAKNYFPSKLYTKSLEKINLNKKYNSYNTINNNNGIKNNLISLSNIINRKNKNINIKENENHNNIGLSKYFYDSQFNQINFWKTRLLYTKSLNNNEKALKNNSKLKNCLTEYNKKNNANPIININNKNNFKNCKSFKLKSFSKERCWPNVLNKYDLIQFNINQLIKRDLKNKDKVVLNMRKTHENFKDKKIMKNKTINVNMDKIKILDYYKN